MKLPVQRIRRAQLEKSAPVLQWNGLHTAASDEEGDHEPSSVAQHLKAMQSRGGEEENNEDDGSGQRRIIVKVLEIRIVVGHADIQECGEMVRWSFWTFAGSIMDQRASKWSMTVRGLV